MIWLPARRQAARLRRSRRASRSGCCGAADVRSTPALDLTDAGGGAGVWHASVRQLASVARSFVERRRDGDRPREADPRRRRSRARPAQATGAASSSSRAAARRGASRTGSASACRASGSERRTLLRRPGVYRGDTRGRPARVSSYRYPERARPARRDAAARRPRAGLPLRDPRPGRERGRRRRLGRRRARTSRRASCEPATRTASPATPALPLRLNPYQPGYFGLIPAVGVFRPAPGAYDLVFDTHQPPCRRPLRASASGSTTRARPSARLLTRTVARGKLLLLRVSDRGSGVDPLDPARAGRRPLPPARLGQGARPRRRQDPDARAAAATSSSSPSPTTRRRRTTRTRARRCRTRARSRRRFAVR